MPDPNRNAQKAALALLLCTQSDLGKLWRENPASVTEQHLRDLGFEAPFLSTAKRLLENAQLRDAVGEFRGVATALQATFWSGEEPHPPIARATTLVSALRKADEGS